MEKGTQPTTYFSEVRINFTISIPNRKPKKAYIKAFAGAMNSRIPLHGGPPSRAIEVQVMQDIQRKRRAFCAAGANILQ